MKLNDLAPPGAFSHDKATQYLADERARINRNQYSKAGMRRTERQQLGPFLRRMATHPERIPNGSFYGIKANGFTFPHLFDHIRLYNRGGKAFAAIFHPYSRLDRDTMKALLDWAFHVGLELLVDADSEYYPGVTLRLVLHREGEEFPPTDLT